MEVIVRRPVLVKAAGGITPDPVGVGVLPPYPVTKNFRYYMYICLGRIKMHEVAWG